MSPLRFSGCSFLLNSPEKYLPKNPIISSSLRQFRYARYEFAGRQFVPAEAKAGYDFRLSQALAFSALRPVRDLMSFKIRGRTA